MPRITKVYTRTGDEGLTRLGGGQQVPKDTLRIATYGTVDELSSVLGGALATGLHEALEPSVRRIQNDLFSLGSDLCILEKDKERRSVPVLEEQHVDDLEELMDRLSKDLKPLSNFILPGGAQGAAWLHLARTVCRRAERLLVTLSREETVGPHTLRYLNRLSDALFVMARWHNHQQGVEEPVWNSRGLKGS